MKNKTPFAIGDTVQTVTAIGKIKETAKLADHIEYFIELPDGTGEWHHEEKISAVKPTINPN